MNETKKLRKEFLLEFQIMMMQCELHKSMKLVIDMRREKYDKRSLEEVNKRSKILIIKQNKRLGRLIILAKQTVKTNC